MSWYFFFKGCFLVFIAAIGGVAIVAALITIIQAGWPAIIISLFTAFAVIGWVIMITENR